MLKKQNLSILDSKMRLFFSKIVVVFVLFGLLNCLILTIIPKDYNSLSYEYNDKLDLLKKTPSPRVILLGGSNVANGVESKRIADALNCNVVNLGLHIGIGIKYPLEDCFNYIKKGDIIVLQCEYGLFYNNWDGNGSKLAHLIATVDKKNFSILSLRQWTKVASGTPQICIGYLIRLVKALKSGSFDSPSSSDEYHFVRDGFNEYGDEVAHLRYPNKPMMAPSKSDLGEVDKSFIKWLHETILKYENVGVKVIMVPPVIVSSYFEAHYSEEIKNSLTRINHPYVVPPLYMALDDSVYFDSCYHVDKEGVRQNTDHLIEILRKQI